MDRHAPASQGVRLEAIRASDVPPPSSVVKVEDGFIVFLESAHAHYDIDLKRCDTKDKLLGWVMHLSMKNWVTAKTIHQFVAVAAKEAGIDPWWPI